jgi:GT2 family glycosyltransferase
MPTKEQRYDRLAVVVVSYNRIPELLRTLRQLSDLSERPPIIAVISGPAESAAKVARQFPAVKVIRARENHRHDARRAGLEAAAADYVAFCDDDAWWQVGSLQRAVEILDGHGRLAVLMGRVVGPDGRDDDLSREIVAGPLPRPAEMPGYPLVGFLAGRSIVRRAALLDKWAMHEAVEIYGDEDWLAAEMLEQGWRLCYSPEICLHSSPSPFRDPRQRRRRLLRSGLCFAWLHRPMVSAMRTTWRLARPWDLDALRAFASAAMKILFAWRVRRLVPAELERSYRLLEDWQNLPHGDAPMVFPLTEDAK